MEQQKIDRINELYHKSKAEGLTEVQFQLDWEQRGGLCGGESKDQG